jgi:hypothetical protein
MPRVEFESKIPAFEQTKTVHALDPAATVIGTNHNCIDEIMGRFSRPMLATIRFCMICPVCYPAFCSKNIKLKKKYRTTILSDPCGCETWCLTEKHGMRLSAEYKGEYSDL